MELIDRVRKNNPVAFKIIKNSVEYNKVSHAYLFSASKNVLIEDEPMLLAQSIINDNPFSQEITRKLEQYPDLTIIDGLGKTIKKEFVTDAIIKLQQKPLDERGIKILIIKNIENGTKESLNSLLKFIEEPQPRTFIIMTTNSISSVLSTIKSRSQIISLRQKQFSLFRDELIVAGVKKQHAGVLATISKSKDDALNTYENLEFESAFNNIVSVMAEARTNHEYIISELTGHIKKTNYKIYLSILRAFFNDIWRYHSIGKIMFIEEEELIGKYSTGFNYQKGLTSIDDFITALNANVNFELYKSKMLIQMRDCYE